jgi:HEAT repeat protein
MSTWLLLLLLTGLLPQDGTMDAVSTELEAEHERVARVFEVHAEEDAEDQERALRSLDPPPLASFVDLLAEESIPAAWFLETEDTDRSDAFGPLGTESLMALRGALAKVPIVELRPFFATLAAEDPRLDRREVCVSVLAGVGERRDLKLVIELATPADERARVLPRSLRKSYESALRSILERDAGGLGYLLGAFNELHGGLSSATVDAIGSVPSEEALAALASLLGHAKGLDAYVLSAIAKLGPDVRHPVSDGVLFTVRSLLTNSDPGVVRAAVRACGRLEDYEAVPQLLEMLSQDDENLRTSAHVALGDITGLPLHADVRIWRSWYERESSWWQGESLDVFRDLASRDELAVSNAINEITGQHLFRHELADALLPVLDHQEPELIVMACRSLGQVGSEVAVPPLVASLEHPDWSVRRAAWVALVRITGQDLPPEIEAWQAEIGS